MKQTPMNSLREEWRKYLKSPKSRANSFEEMVADWWINKFTQRIEEVEKEIKNWLYQYENYPTMMASRKSFQRGTMARDMSKEILSLLQELKK